MRCPKHTNVWLYENMLETEGYCPVCLQWYKLEELKTFSTGTDLLEDSFR